MGDVLAGIHATWQFESDAIVIRFERGIRTPRLFGTLRERRIPHEALASVTLAPGKRGTVVLHAVPRPGADPLVEAAAGQLKEGGDPYRLVLPVEREAQAAYYREELLALLPPDAAEPADGFLVAAPEGPQSFKAYDGKASFDGSAEVVFRWSRTGASSEKWRAGDQVFPVRELGGVEWHSPESPDGCLRLLPRGAVSASGRPAHPERDPASVVFGLGYGPVHESLPFAAAVLAAIRGSARVPALPCAAPPYDPAGVAERIRHLGELHQAGLVTDEEFSSRKAELLAEL
ncbi:MULTISPECIES: DUF4429 domain-containing protein [unclassified Streptomyces]|uniref:DUF4429 domain-containing protein n=1 Tax=unclassified Streptomyces TaxID=2593676 RepID=UPI002E36DCD2|nr:DUF4429 domain-containing protein [Streptomyces sp. NBC_01268]